MRTRSRLAGVLTLIVLVAGGCSKNPAAPTTFQLLGWLKVQAQLSDAVGNPTGVRELDTADSVVVRLLGFADATRTTTGQYLFRAPAGTYAGSCEIAGVPTDTTRAIVLSGLDIATTDTLKLRRQGDLTASPNPFTTAVAITFSLAASETISLRVVTLAGSPVRTLLGGQYDGGVHQVTWDGTNDAAATVPDGWYGVVLTGTIPSRAEIIIKGP